MVKVRATKMSSMLNKKIEELNRVANEGEIFDITESRFVFLNGSNPDGVVFVTEVCEQQDVYEMHHDENDDIILEEEHDIDLETHKKRNSKKD